MKKEYSTNETHLSKDELLQIINEIDSEKQNDIKTAKDHGNDSHRPPRHPNPGNPFF